MNQDLLYYITNHAGSLSIQEIVMNLLAALLAGAVIFLSYRFSHSSAVYSPRFNVSLWMLTVVTAMVMCVIGNNIALSLGMVGALSIVRFRTAIKDARDTVYIFWAVSVGICCGISDFVIAIIGSMVIFLLMLAIGTAGANARYLLIVRCLPKGAAVVEELMQEKFSGKVRLCVKNSNRDSVEYIYELSQKQATKFQEKHYTDTLLENENVTEANLINQRDEISA